VTEVAFLVKPWRTAPVAIPFRRFPFYLSRLSRNNLQGAESMVSRAKISGKDMEAIASNAAGIDIGSERHYVAVDSESSDKPVRSFGCYTPDLEEMAK
jgi:hypothetical protein